MFNEECIPFAPALVESMRSLGYSFESAIADLIDNSVSALADRIEIIAKPGDDPSMIIFDDGCGMTKKELYEAMRYGSQNPLVQRSENDLGRFGLGMKAASLSQCRSLVVVSKKDGEIWGYSWDMDFIVEEQSWMLKGYAESELKEYPYIDMFDEVEHGTYIYLTKFDRIKESSNDVSNTFNRHIYETSNHLALVFHRFIDDGLNIYVNKIKLKARDPFLRTNRATQQKRESSFYINDEKITLKPFILPHMSKLKQDDLDKIGGKDKLRNEQGFYVYRNKRLIIWGTWFRLERKDELSKLARVMVDIPNSLDNMWSIDIKKSKAVLPDIIKQNMFNAVYEAVASSENVHQYRGRRKKKKEEVEYVWERILRKDRDGYKYEINRKIPQIELLASTLEKEQLVLLDKLISTIEESFPVSALYVDVAKGKVEENKVQEKNNEEVEELWDELQEQIDYVKQTNGDVEHYYRLFMKTEPYCNFEIIGKRICEEIGENEG